MFSWAKRQQKIILKIFQSSNISVTLLTHFPDNQQEKCSHNLVSVCSFRLSSGLLGLQMKESSRKNKILESLEYCHVNLSHIFGDILPILSSGNKYFESCDNRQTRKEISSMETSNSPNETNRFSLRLLFNFHFSFYFKEKSFY